ncbi:hypothetical protein GAGA_3151 [Paraglaciecola agarilytica NO2]|uniref:Uncharacterized protein n=1 Tax=Paraglaciecola agarilytica NO2 TaxID=1125747 RepID=A0ABQ0I9H4_9ALTE|nr:hypothetical protein GAGA_3151 [Paraglaciecola agarilytica NO2]
MTQCLYVRKRNFNDEAWTLVLISGAGLLLTVIEFKHWPCVQFFNTQYSSKIQAFAAKVPQLFW